MKPLLASFEQRAPSKSRVRSSIRKINEYLTKNFFGYKARFQSKFWNYRALILGKNSFQMSTNGIEAINRSLKLFLGLGMCNQKRLDDEMNKFHSQKVNISYAAIYHNRMKNIRRKTIANQNS